MVEVGELTVVGSFDGSQIDSGFDRLNNNLNETENQANQTNASLGKTDLTLTSLTKAAIGFGLAGVAAVTAIATKSPVLAGSMAKIEVETLKLSNVLGGQLKPIFDEIGQDLIPAITSAFANSEEGMKRFTDKTVELIAAISDLIRLDWEGLLAHLDKLFAPKLAEKVKSDPTLTDEQKKIIENNPFVESISRAIDIVATPFNEKSVLSQNPVTAIPTFMINLIIDLFQAINKELDSKQVTFANATGVPR